MKSLAFFCSIWLLSVAARAEVAVGLPGSSTSNAATPLNWSAAIEKFGKEGAAAEGVESKLLEQHLLNGEPTTNLTAAPEPARAASGVPAAKGAASAAGGTNAAIAGAATSANKKGEEDLVSQIRHSVWDVVKPFQELLPGSTVDARPVNEEGAGGAGGTGGAIGGGGQSGGQRYAPRSESQKRVEKIRSDVLLDQLLDELKPWAFAALGLGILGFGLNQWMAYMKRKPSVKPTHGSSRKRRSRSL
jgi:hypothetical protein